MDTEELILVGPAFECLVSSVCCNFLKLLDSVFVRVLGVDCLVFEEVEVVIVDGGRLGMAANKVHLNPAFLGVVVCAMFKRVDIEITV